MLDAEKTGSKLTDKVNENARLVQALTLLCLKFAYLLKRHQPNKPIFVLLTN